MPVNTKTKMKTKKLTKMHISNGKISKPLSFLYSD